MKEILKKIRLRLIIIKGKAKKCKDLLYAS